MIDGGDPRRLVALVVCGFAVAFAVVLVAVQFGGASAAGVLTLPLVVGLPLAAAGAYWLLRNR